MNILDDTIVGISTALGRGAISIVRVSGAEAIETVNKIFRGKDLKKVNSHTVHYGFIFNNETKEDIDEVLVSVFKAPKTYTKEDLVEINCHGGQLVTQYIYDQLVEMGCRIAEPGEFTKRAFLNGRIDLTKAEAVLDIIDAENKTALKIANQGIKGKTFKKISQERERLLNLMMQIAVNIDYPEYDDVEELTNKEILPILLEVNKEINILLDASKDAVKLKQGIDTVIVGKPNVGKSSLLNALLDENRAIVTEIPGTTRDVIEARLNLGSFMLNLIDTAGIRDAKDVVEKLGIEKSQEKINEADLILMIFDGSRELEEEDIRIYNAIKDKKHICIVNKNDLELKLDTSILDKYIHISTTNLEDITILEDVIKKTIFEKDININSNTYISNTRQIGKLKEANENIEKAINDIYMNQYVDFIELSIRAAWESLGEILGEVNDDEFINNMFKNFCLGK